VGAGPDLELWAGEEVDLGRRQQHLAALHGLVPLVTGLLSFGWTYVGFSNFNDT
jgi:hypothetical protein